MIADAAHAQRLVSIWAGVRIAVVDVETATDADARQHIVSIGVVTVKGGRITGRWSSLVNPGVPIDEFSHNIHHLTDADVASAPDFAGIAGTVRSLLTAGDGELLVFAGHNVAFDASVLRWEYKRIDEKVPELPVLDTMRALPKAAGLGSGGQSLEALCETLGIINTSPHEALADAEACAEALIALVELAVSEGHHDFASLLTEVSGTKTTRNTRARITKTNGPTDPNPPLPDEHLASHSLMLSKRAGARMLQSWHDQVDACADLRCELLEDRVASTLAPANKTYPVLFAVLQERAHAGDIAGVATVLGPLLSLCAVRWESRPRHELVAEAKRWTATLHGYARCGDEDLCPACRLGDPCPLDAWPDVLGPLVLGDPGRSSRSFLSLTGKDAGTGPYLTWQSSGIDERVSDAALVTLLDHLRVTNDERRAERLVAVAWRVGCRHADVTVAHAVNLAAAGRKEDLADAIAACDEALARRGGSTTEAWRRLASTRNRLAGRARQAEGRPTGEVDEDGNPKLHRLHRPENPRWVRTPRFVRL